MSLATRPAPESGASSERENAIRVVKFRLAEALALGFEQIVFGQAARETEEPGVRHHSVRRAHAPAAHGPAALQHLKRLEHPESPHLAEALEESLHLAHVRAVGADDSSRPQRRSGPAPRLPTL